MILMYHHVCPASEIPTDPVQIDREGWQYSLEPRQFAHHLRSLSARGFRFVGLGEYVAALRATGRPPRRAVVVTFDDGWLDNFQHALPVLAKHTVPATFFVVSGPWRDVLPGRRMKPEHLRELVDRGMTIGSHTRTHCTLTFVDRPTAAAELSGSRADLEAITGKPVRFLAYPGGRFNREVAAVAAECGFEAACSVVAGGVNTADSLMWLCRDTLSPGLDAVRDWAMLNPFLRRVAAARARTRIRRLLRSPSVCP